LAGNSAYVIKPHAAQQLIDLVDSIGAWPNDAIMCRQLIDGLEEHYPFITEVQAEQSTIR
jgi:GR25 family glycosyltransferase involved in LPS biosynthesis